jgi:hypothetical protein
VAGETLVEVFADTKGGGTCRSCDARLTWFETIGGKRMPFDGEPVPRQSRHEGATHRLIESYSSDDVHWRTCPDANKWRRR